MICNLQNLTQSTPSEFKARAISGWEKLFKRQDVGFIQLPQREHLWSASLKRAQEIRAQASHLGVLGIGGSSLGAQALKEAVLGTAHSEVTFFDNVDARAFWQKVKDLEPLRQVHWLIISKSGNTLETLAGAEFLHQHLREVGLKLSDQATVISELKDNPLTQWAKKNQVPVLEIPPDVGGRFSVLSPVGLLPAAFLNIPLEEMRQGAMEAIESKDLVCELAAQGLASFARNEWITLFWIYADDLKTFGYWLQQLWAESLAKAVTLDGQTAPRVSSPFVGVGAVDQHSLLQQISEGARDKFIWFIREQRAENTGPRLKNNEFFGMDILKGKGLGDLLAAEAQATQQTLAEVGVSSLTLHMGEADARTMGGAFMLMELVVAVMGECLGINTFDQPGVEAGKLLARRIMSN